MKTLFRIVVSLTLGIVTATAGAQDAYPNRPVTLVLGFSPGGIGDGIVRQIAEFARERRGATVLVDYKPGAASTIASTLVKRAPADGYMVSLMSPSAMMVAPHFQKLPYDPVQDFSYLGLVMAQPMPMYVPADSPHRTLADVTTHARAHPGKFRWGTAGVNTLAQIVMQSVFAREGVDTVNVPFKGGADAITALLGGHIDAVVSTDFGPLLAADKVRLVVETGENRAQPQVQTLKELGYPLVVSVEYGIFGPAGLPADVVRWWDSLLEEFSESPVYQAFARRYFGVPIYATPDTAARKVIDGYRNVGAAIKSLGLQGSN